ncbi:unnamed protein product [marine sediment metagenome]|uniref:Uncharacterized protein n=1 Tax=marine sediment metagenome TaxID=412755 RepID=X1QKV9_9ZZZZ
MRQSNLVMRNWAKGAITRVPIPIPVMVSPSAIPLLFINQRGTVEVIGTIQKPIPVPITMP